MWRLLVWHLPTTLWTEVASVAWSSYVNGMVPMVRYGYFEWAGLCRGIYRQLRFS